MRFDVDDPDVLPFRIHHQKIDATVFNTIRLGILRLGNPLTLSLDTQPNIKCTLSDNKWVLVDLMMHEFPLLVWREFKTIDRGLHEPVHCKAHVYHLMAGRLLGTALYTLEDQIRNILQATAR